MKKITKKVKDEVILEVPSEAIESPLENEILESIETPIEEVNSYTRECLCGELLMLSDEVITCKCGRKHIK